MGLFKSLFSRPSRKERVIKKYYSYYPETPYISDDRDFDDWLTRVEMFPKQCLVAREMMMRYDDGLLPGHIYMLYWLGKYTNKEVPAYFEYRYGIDFEKEKRFLSDIGYLDSNSKPTKKGKEAIERHKHIIEERHPAPANVGTPSTPAPIQESLKRTISLRTNPQKETIPNHDIPLIKSEISYINDIVKYACKLAGVTRNPSIDPSKLVYGLSMKETHYEWTPYTKSGKPAKYPLMLRYAYGDTHNPLPPNECFGELYYLQNGAIGKARLIFWRRNTGYFINLGQTKNKLVVKKVEKSNPPNRTILYKE